MTGTPIRFRQLLKDGTFYYWGFINNGFTAPAQHVAFRTRKYLTMEEIEKHSDQFTGFSDAAGNDIYEHDILERSGVRCVVEWRKGSWTVRNSNGFRELLSPVAKSSNVVSNIHRSNI